MLGEKHHNASVMVEEERCSLISSDSQEEETVFGTLLVSKTINYACI